MGKYYGVSEEEKNYWLCLSHENNKLAALWAGAAAAIGLTGDLPAAGIAGIAAAYFWYLSDEAGDVADDPPQPNFRRKVKINDIHFRLPKTDNSTLIKLNYTTELVIKNVPLIKGILQAIERGQGAQAAENEKYALMHTVTARQLHKKIMENFDVLGPSLASLADEIKGTEYDIKVTHENVKDFQKQVRNEGLPAYLKAALTEAGFSKTLISRYKKWLVDFYVRQLWSDKMSYILKVVSNIMIREQGNLAKQIN